MNTSVTYWLEGWLCLVVCVTGVLMNSYAIWTLLRQKHSAIFHRLMLALVTYDLFYVMLTSLTYSLPNLSFYYRGRKNNDPVFWLLCHFPS